MNKKCPGRSMFITENEQMNLHGYFHKQPHESELCGSMLMDVTTPGLCEYKLESKESGL